VIRSGGRLLADQLVVHGADLAFCVPGESYLGLLDGIHARRDRIRLISARHEAGAANMAEAAGKLTGRPGICLVTRGPGATQASVGVHTAFQDSTPLILLVGQIARGQRDREAFQEVDLPAFFAPLAKWAAEIDDAARIPEYLSRAFHVATSGRPGPVVLGLPEDMQRDAVDVPDAAPYRPARPSAAAADVEELHGLLRAARRPLVVLGGSIWSQQAADALAAFAEASDLPVACQFRRQDHVDNASPCYIGDLGLGVNPTVVERLAASDLVVLLGGRFGDVPSGAYGRLAVAHAAGGRRLVHVHASPDELNLVYEADLAIAAAAPSVVDGLVALGPIDPGGRDPAWRADARASFEAWTEPAPRRVDGVDLGHVLRTLRELLPPDAVVTNGAGNYTVWVHRYHRHRRYGTQLAPTSGAMGYGLPAALAARAVSPAAPIVAFAGDGCFMMAAPELATAVQHDLPVVAIVADNGMFGTIRMHQERSFPGRVEGTDLVNPDFAALARACGWHAARAERDAEVEGALREALAAGRPALVHLRCDPDAITPATTLAAIRERA